MVVNSGCANAYTGEQGLLDAAELAALVAFLASEQASYITAQSIAVDGGWIKSLF